jgi:hypothetical protein
MKDRSRKDINDSSVKEIVRFLYGTRRFSALITKGCNWPMFGAILVQLKASFAVCQIRCSFDPFTPVSVIPVVILLCLYVHLTNGPVYTGNVLLRLVKLRS